MTKEALCKIKQFAFNNFCTYGETGDCDKAFGVSCDELGIKCINPWIDQSGRFQLTDKEAVDEWGLTTVVDFCEKAKPLAILAGGLSK